MNTEGKETSEILPTLLPPLSYFWTKHWRYATLCTELRYEKKNRKLLCNWKQAQVTSDSRWEGTQISSLLHLDPFCNNPMEKEPFHCFLEGCQMTDTSQVTLCI